MLNSTTTVAVSLNIISSIINLFALITCLILLSLIVYRLITTRLSETERLSLCLTINTLCAFIIMCVLMCVGVHIPAIRRDFSTNSFVWETDSMQCRLLGYALFTLICSVYWSYALQAFFRFVKVVYPLHSWLNRIKMYLSVFIPIQWILAFIVVVPLLTSLNGIHLLLPNEIYCGLQLGDIPSLLYASFAEVWIPVLIISGCYYGIIRTVRQRSLRSIIVRENKRDVQMVRRIIIMIFILSMISIPSIIDLIVFWVSSDHLDPLLYRITWLSLSIGSLILSILIPRLVTHVHIFEYCKKRRPRIETHR